MEYSREELCLIWLQCAPALSWRNVDALLQKYGSAEQVWLHFSSSLREEIGNDAYTQLEKMHASGMDDVIAQIHASGACAVSRMDKRFPGRLLDLQAPPKVLFVRGTLPDSGAHAVAVIGARHDTRYGRNQAFRIARQLASEGVVIVSGLARGIDSAAHRGALEGGGITVGVLGCGINRMYPPENQELADEIIRNHGAVISEFAPDAEPIGFHFPIRNRIISGLSDAVLLIEAQKKSGTASTVNYALDQGKEVFVLPGNVDAPGSELPLSLLKEGAPMCTEAGDILDLMGWRAKPRQTSLFKDEEEDTRREEAEADPILRALAMEEKTFEELLDETGLGIQELNTRTTMLELEGKIERRGGRSYALLQRP